MRETYNVNHFRFTLHVSRFTCHAMPSLPDFHDPSLLERALTHRSYLNEHPELALDDNERLEFLGDAVLDFVTGAWLYNRFPEQREGRLTSLRAALVKTETLGQFALR